MVIALIALTLTVLLLAALLAAQSHLHARALERLLARVQAAPQLTLGEAERPRPVVAAGGPPPFISDEHYDDERWNEWRGVPEDEREAEAS